MSERQERLLDLLEEWRERTRIGQNASPADLCADCPELLLDLEQQIRFQQRVDPHAGAATEPGEAAFSESFSTVRPDGRRVLLPLTGPDIPVIPDYDILDQLGKGGMGAVWLARDQKLGRLVALKVILDGLPGPAQLARFQAEAATLAGLNHDHIVKLFGVGKWRSTEGGVELPYLILEYVEGGNLENRLGGQPVDPVEAARLLRLLARAIQAAHRQGVIHRDLKPANVLLAPADADGDPALYCAWGRPKLTDFGLAGRLEGGAGLTRSGAVLGTPGYMSPEQAEGKVKEVGPAADVYGLGVILYQLLTGRPPFEGKSAAIIQYRVITEAPVSPRRRRPVVPEALDSLCLRCLAKDPTQRPSVAELLQELTQFLAAAPPSTTKPPSQARSDAAPEDSARPRDRTPPNVIPPRRPQPQELAFLQSVVENPGDETPYRVLADWLAEHDDPRRAELLRLHRQLLATCCEPDRHPERATHQVRLVELLAEGVRPCVPQHIVELGEGVEMMFTRVPRGTFLMGSPPDEKERSDNETQHRVTLTRGFYLGVHPVTQQQWQAVMGSNPSDFKGENRPVENVSWEDCQAFCKKLSERIGTAFRLPTEAEWEYACRAGTTTPFHFGATISTDQANYDGNYIFGQGEKGVYREETTPVGGFPANAWGLYDMHGNVWEWCADWYEAYPSEDIKDPKSSNNGDARVVRGGSWCNGPGRCRSAYRGRRAPAGRIGLYGCRVVLCLHFRCLTGGPRIVLFTDSTSVVPEVLTLSLCRRRSSSSAK